jgi:hypothetical protein
MTPPFPSPYHRKADATQHAAVDATVKSAARAADRGYQ